MNNNYKNYYEQFYYTLLDMDCFVLSGGAYD